MRILLIISRFLPELGGAERQANLLARKLRERGHQVTVLTRQIRGLPATELLDGIAVRRGIRTVDFGPLYGMTYVFSVAWFLLRNRANWDVIHITYLYLDAFSAVLTRRIHGLPVIVRPACAGYYGDLARLGRFRAWPFFPGPRGITLRAMLRTISGADTFIATSNELREELKTAGAPPERILRIPNGVDLRHFCPNPETRSPQARRRLGLPAGPLVTFTGRLDPQKGLRILLKAFGSLQGTQPAASLLLLGDGPQRAELEHETGKLALAGRVVFRGPVTDVAPYLQASDVFVLPSVGEGMPNALLEAMATGLPCIASEIGGCIDAITQGETGILVPPGDPSALRDAMERLLQSPQVRLRMGTQARASVSSRFDLETVVERYEACLLASGARQPLVEGMETHADGGS